MLVFCRTSKLLEEICFAVDGVLFYGSLWECILSNSANRLCALNFVMSHFEANRTMSNQLHFMGTNVEVLVSLYEIRFG